MAKSETDLRSMLANGLDPKQLAWYEDDLEEIAEPAKTLLEKYSKIPSDQIVKHVNDMVSTTAMIHLLVLLRAMFTDSQGSVYREIAPLLFFLIHALARSGFWTSVFPSHLLTLRSWSG